MYVTFKIIAEKAQHLPKNRTFNSGSVLCFGGLYKTGGGFNAFEPPISYDKRSYKQGSFDRDESDMPISYDKKAFIGLDPSERGIPMMYEKRNQFQNLLVDAIKGDMAKYR